MYYTGDGKYFTSKIQAVEYASKSNLPLNYYYFDDVYKKVNWGIEPAESIDFLYKVQAQKIRDEYDYVVLMYSGGYDSTNILEVFHFNNIKIDKIVVTGAFSKDTSNYKDQNHNAEIYLNAFPYLEDLGLNSITQVIDNSTLYNDPANFSIFEYGDDWADHIGSRFSPHHFFWRDLDRHVEIPVEYKDKKIAFIWGTDKPLLQKNQNGSLFFCFMDTVITSYGRVNQPFKYNVTNINFYWDPTFPAILTKQLHMIKKLYLEDNISLPYKTDHKNNTGLVYLIYDFKKPINYKSSKTSVSHFAKRDFFLNEHRRSDLYKFYERGIKKVVAPSVFKNVNSKQYIIYSP
jgi:hypothetical protein